MHCHNIGTFNKIFLLDEVDAKDIEPIFDEYFYRLQRSKYLELYRFMDNSYLVSMDGSGYFGSDKICCPGCLRKEDKKGNVSYSHQIMQAVLTHPDMKQIIPLTPEEIRNTDGDLYELFSIKSFGFFFPSNI